MTIQEIKGFKKAIRLLEQKLNTLGDDLDKEQIAQIAKNKILQNSGVSLSIYWLKEEIKRNDNTGKL